MTDWRLPEHRKQVFQDFYEFHLQYKSHPGCVYYIIPYLREKLGWDDEQTLWFAFINGNTQHPVTSLILHEQFSTPDHASALVNYWENNYDRLEFDTDRRYHKKFLETSIKGYKHLLRGATQKDFWNTTAEKGFTGIWNAVSAIPSFGRLSAFSYSEYLRIAGVPFDCDTLFLDDHSGSRSHRNGLCIVLGLDEYDWHKSNPTFNGKYPHRIMQLLKTQGALVLEEQKERARGKPWEQDVSYFTLESTLCTYKSWHRPNRRYPNVYNDMLHDRIKKSEINWPEKDLSIFWDARAATLPDHLLLERNPNDPGLHPDKQNHYRTTGEVIMMNHEYPQYKNSFNERTKL